MPERMEPGTAEPEKDMIVLSNLYTHVMIQAVELDLALSRAERQARINEALVVHRAGAAKRRFPAIHLPLGRLMGLVRPVRAAGRLSRSGADI